MKFKEYVLIAVNWTYSDESHILIVSADNIKNFSETLFEQIKKSCTTDSSCYSNLPCISLHINDIAVDFEEQLMKKGESFPFNGTITKTVEILICD